MSKALLSICIAIFLMSGTGRALAQMPHQQFEKGKLILPNKQHIKLSNVVLDDSLFTATNTATGENFEMAYSDVKRLKVLGDNRMMWEGFAIGAASAVGISVVYVLAEGDPLNLQNYGAALTRMVPFMAALGGMVGVTIKRYDLVPYNKWQNQPLSYQHSKGYGLGICLNF